MSTHRQKTFKNVTKETCISIFLVVGRWIVPPLTDVCFLTRFQICKNRRLLSLKRHCGLGTRAV